MAILTIVAIVAIVAIVTIGCVDPPVYPNNSLLNQQICGFARMLMLAGFKLFTIAT